MNSDTEKEKNELKSAEEIRNKAIEEARRLALIKCKICGSKIPVYYCVKCHTDLCEDHISKCKQCEHIYCKDCITHSIEWCIKINEPVIRYAQKKFRLWIFKRGIKWDRNPNYKDEHEEYVERKRLQEG